MQSIRNKQIFRQFSIAVIVISLICPLSLLAKRKGASLVVTVLDGDLIVGRLLRCKEDSLIIKTNTEGITINIKEIDSILVKKKSRRRFGAFVGFLVGGAVSYAISFHKYKYYWFNFLYIGGITLGGSLLGQSIGSHIGSSVGEGETYRVKGESQNQIKYVLWKMKNIARFKD